VAGPDVVDEVDGAVVGAVAVVDGAGCVVVGAVVVDGAEVVEPVPVDEVEEPVDVVDVFGAVVVAGAVVPVTEPVVGVVVLADARPGVTSVAATARASAAAGRALRMEWCMVPLSASGVATVAPVHPGGKTKPPFVALTTKQGVASDLVGVRAPPRVPRRIWSRFAFQAFRLATLAGGLRLRVSAGLGPASPVARRGVTRGRRPDSTPGSGGGRKPGRAVGHGPLDWVDRRRPGHHR